MLTFRQFYNNELTALPCEIGNLLALELFDLSYNALTALPAELGQLSSLEALYVRPRRQRLSATDAPPAVATQQPRLASALDESLAGDN